ncbi:hypothetical protein QOZ80_9BG0694220 [Eleusine coracana subsp. coracana]|nr:hypothetical protein QOZ80_9BG0694220 [Eleusine coracana subsp. coracana]
MASPQPQPAMPHVLLIPYPAQGHVNPFLKLAKALHARSFHVTFVNTEYNHGRLIRARGAGAVAGDERLRFDTIPDGLPPSDLDATQDIWALCEATRRTGPAALRELVERIGRRTDGVPPVSCVIADGAMGYAVHVAKEMGLPAYLFFTTSGCGFLGYLNFDQLVKKGCVPLKDDSCLSNGYLDTPVDWMDGMLPGVRLRDLPTFIRTTNGDDTMLCINIKQCEVDAPAASGILLNTFDDLEQRAVDAIRGRLPNTFTIGPLLVSPSPSSSYLPWLTSSLWRDDDRCAAWLDDGHKEDGSVVYVNFGSITVVTGEQMDEFAWGLAASGFPFLWVVRPDMVRGDDDGAGWAVPAGFDAAVAGRGLMVGWCDQEAVLGHRATGGFLSHCGWNSTLESIRAGVPMLCWPFFAEQVTNCRYVCEEWGMGMEMPREAGRDEVEAAVRELMGNHRARSRAVEWKDKSNKAVAAPEGSSHMNFQKFVDEIIAHPTTK